MLSGCASIISESSSPVVITSTPDKADFVIIDNAGKSIHSGVTPQTVTLDTGGGYFKPGRYNIDYKKPGYQAATTPLNAGINGWYFGNILLGGLIGMLIIDPATGAMWKLPPTNSTSLTAQPGTSSTQTEKPLSIIHYD